MEEALRSGAVTAVLGEAAKGEPVRLRRLQLAAERGQASAVLLRPMGADTVAGPAITRWEIGSVAHSETNTPPLKDGWTVKEKTAGTDLRTRLRAHWRIDLIRCKAGTPASWIVEWYDETGHLRLAADISNRPTIETSAQPSPGIADTACSPSGDGRQGQGWSAVGGRQ
jgi:protein ImuA